MTAVARKRLLSWTKCVCVFYQRCGIITTLMYIGMSRLRRNGLKGRLRETKTEESGNKNNKRGQVFCSFFLRFNRSSS